MDVRFGEPVEAGDRAAVEWWATLMLTAGEEHALAGCSVLRFDDEGLVVEARDYWHMEPGRREPPRLGTCRALGGSGRAGSGRGRGRVRGLLDRRARAARALRAVPHLDRGRLVGDHRLQPAVAVTALGARPRRAPVATRALLGAGLVVFLAASIACALADGLGVPDRRADRPGRRCGAPARRLAAGARRARRLDGAGARLWILAGTFGARARAGARRRADAGLRLAGDLRAQAPVAALGLLGARPLARARGRGGGLAAVAPPDAAGERLPRAALRRARRSAVPRRPARDQRLGLLADRRRRRSSASSRWRRCRAAARRRLPRLIAVCGGPRCWRRAGRPRAAAVGQRRLHGLVARALRRRPRPGGAGSLARGARRGRRARRAAAR